MPRILLLIVLLWLLYVVGKRFITKVKSKDAKSDSTAKEEKIVACSQCGVHIPESESRLIGNAVVCNNPDCQKDAS